MPKLDENQAAFVDNPFVGVVTAIRPDGSPHSTVVWVDREDGVVTFNTARGRAKDGYLQRDPRASLLVVDPNDAYRWIAVSGPVEMSEDGADAQIDRLAKKYLGKDTYPFRRDGEVRVTVRIDADRIDSSGFDG